MSLEEWRDINDFEGLYQISNLGRVKSLERVEKARNGRKRMIKEKILTGGEYIKGYKFVCLSKDYKKKQISVHRLVAITFIPNNENKPQVNHIDGDIRNNTLSNLEWNTNSENGIHSYRVLGRKNARGMLGKCGVLNARSKPVYQFTLDGEFLRSYESGRQAAFINNFKQCGISSAARGRYKQAHGFKWSYIDPNL